jgi:hypothetical protein
MKPTITILCLVVFSKLAALLQSEWPEVVAIIVCDLRWLNRSAYRDIEGSQTGRLAKKRASRKSGRACGGSARAEARGAATVRAP